jgi:Domain of unknown function (DUF4139)
MKHLILSIFFCGLIQTIQAQKIPVTSATIFKNGRTLLTKSGKVQTTNGKYVSKELPNALFGTFWVNSPDLESVFCIEDSVLAIDEAVSEIAFLSKNKGKMMQIWVKNAENSPPDILEGVLTNIINESNQYLQSLLIFKTNTGKNMVLKAQNILRFEYFNDINTEFLKKKSEKRYEINFKNNKPEQPIEQYYLTSNLGWTPIYRLDMTDKNKGKLALRAEIINDAEDLDVAELKLAVGIPNFMYATKQSQFLSFVKGYDFNMDINMGAIGSIGNRMSQNAVVYQRSEDSFETVVNNGTLDGSQTEDFYFYKLKTDNFPKNSRYQLPVFETDIAQTHFYECKLQQAIANNYNQYTNQGQGVEAKTPVTHYIEFLNNTPYPWTTGVANISSMSDRELQPISQDMLPYTPSGAKCKVRIAETPEIRVTHAEGEIEREENIKTFFSHEYDRVKIEGQICVVNYKKETVKIKVSRELEGVAGKSSITWKTPQEQATLRINPAFIAEWELELKPGEERKWKYDYDVFVNF